MGMNETPSGERVHIAFFGRRNAGKSSLVNAVTGQELAIVSDIRGTTTDPVYKSMELLPLGPVVIIDTPGIDDEGELGLKRVGKTRQVLNKADLAVLVVDAVEGISSWEEEMIRLFEKKEIPYLVVYNKMDLLTGKSEQEPVVEHTAYVSARTREGIQQLKEQMAHLTSQETDEKRLAADLVKPFDTVILVVPIDKAAPKGRLILPQQQVIQTGDDTGGDGGPGIGRSRALRRCPRVGESDEERHGRHRTGHGDAGALYCRCRRRPRRGRRSGITGPEGLDARRRRLGQTVRRRW